MQQKLCLSLLLAVVASAALAQGPTVSPVTLGLDPVTGYTVGRVTVTSADLTSITLDASSNIRSSSIGAFTPGQPAAVEVAIIQDDPFDASSGTFTATDSADFVSFILDIPADTTPPACVEGPITVSGGLASRIVWIHDNQSPIDVIGDVRIGPFSNYLSEIVGDNNGRVTLRQTQTDQPATLSFFTSDSAGNFIYCSTSIELPIVGEPDILPPSIMPIPGTDANGNAEVTVTVSDGGSGVATIGLTDAVNGSVVPPTFTPGVLFISFDFIQADPLLASSLNVTAMDTAGNVATAAVTIPPATPPDTTPPDITYVVSSGAATVTVADADSGLNAVQLTNPVNGAAVPPVFSPGDKLAVFSFTQADQYLDATLDVSASDAAGNSSAVTVVLIPAAPRPPEDTAPPEYNITLSPGLADVSLADAGTGLNAVSFGAAVNGSAVPPVITSGDPSAVFTFIQANPYLPSGLDVTASDVAGNAVNFTVTVPPGLSDTTPPTIVYKGWVKIGTTYYAKFQVTDSQSGVQSIGISNMVNCLLQMPVFTPGVTVVDFTVSWINPSKGLSFFETLTDMAGNVYAADPIEALVVKASNKPVFYGPYVVSQNESHVHVENSSPGLTRLTIVVNRRVFQVKLADGQTVDMSVAKAMVPGDNSISFVAYGGQNLGVASVSVN